MKEPTTDWFRIHTSRFPGEVQQMANGSRLFAALERMHYPVISPEEFRITPSSAPHHETLWPWAGWMQ